MRIALVGNPNTGKSTLFNALTGLNQKIGNFPGVTVDKKIGYSKLPNGTSVEIIDLPGCYSLYPKSQDEAVVLDVLADPNNASHPALILFVADATNLKRNLLLYSQVADLGIPIVLALNMIDDARKKQIVVDIDGLSQALGTLVVPISARKGENMDALRQAILNAPTVALQKEMVSMDALLPVPSQEVVSVTGYENSYHNVLLLNQHELASFVTDSQREQLGELLSKYHIVTQEQQQQETIKRYSAISSILDRVVSRAIEGEQKDFSYKLDQVLTHKVWGFASFFLILMLIFQAIFAWAEAPMALIEELFAWMDQMGRTHLPEGALTDLLLDGILAGLGGILVFIPQIAILFCFVAILEDTGYMARITFLMDKMMRKVGLNGKSVVPLIGGLACAVPSIMAARNIENWKDRIITIMVTPLVSCAARLPVYTLLISLTVPSTKVLGVLNLQGLALLGMYLLGVVGAIVVAWVMKKIIKARGKSYFIQELPIYRMPRWRNVFLTMYEKVKTFVFEVGKVIIAISIVLWVLASYGPPSRFEAVERKYEEEAFVQNYPEEEIEQMKSAELLENSYVGILGKTIEPAIRPLGFDWKIGIALITSFAAREVFVGTMATIYSVEEPEDDTSTIREKMAAARFSDTGEPVYTLATAFSLMVFYAFAMQCMSTVAVVYRETKSWKWPMIQLAYMTAMAYFSSLLVYQFFG